MVHQQAFSVLLLISVLLVWSDRRLMPWILLIEHLLVVGLLTPHLYPAVAASRVALGIAIWLIMLLGTYGRRSKNDMEEPQRDAVVLVRVLYRLFGMALAGVFAYALWQQELLSSLAPLVGLASLWLAFTGMALLILGHRRSIQGVAILTLLNGAEAAYLYAQRSLVIFGLLGVTHLVVALAVIYHADRFPIVEEKEERTPC